MELTPTTRHSNPKMGQDVTRQTGDRLDKIEAAQAALRVSIEKTKRLAEQTDRLIERHKKDVGAGR